MFSKKLSRFLILAYALSWIIAAILYLSGLYTNKLAASLALGLYMLMPAVAVIILEKKVYGKPLKDTMALRFSWNGWWWLAWLSPVFFALAVLGVNLTFPNIHYSPDMAGIFERFADMLSPEQLEEMKNQELPLHPFWLTLIQGLIAGITLNALMALGEEMGWRGFLYREFHQLSFGKAGIIMGTLWGLWHAPIILKGHNYPQHPVAGVFIMILWCIFLTPAHLLLRAKAKSVIAPAILHGTINGTAGLPLILIAGGNDLTTGATGLPGFIVLLIINSIIFGIWSPKLSLAKLEAGES
ncbi:MAG TPA: CPBP family intramembrane metalloprotease [Candidatus Marinimicrobia bacterium]|nr:CPBP family intramembrane metalloprotease [Candidatus Neomarinimicrobiota bacterium]